MVPVVPELIGLICAVAVLAFMYVRAPQSEDSDIDITQELPIPPGARARSKQPALPAPITPSREPYRGRPGPAWITATGEFVIAGDARRGGDLALAEVQLERTLRRPPLASRVAEESPPPPGCASLAIVTSENCAETTLRVVTSGRPRSSTTALVLAVNAREGGPFRLRGRFEVRA